MRLSKYEDVSRAEVVTKICNNIVISYLDKEKIEKALREFEIIRYKKREGKNAFMRLTAPLFIIFVSLAVVIVLFPNWVVTGSFGFDHKNKFGGFIRRWKRSIWG